ncbi:UNC93-like protein MFSD11 [Diabrotica virgifera virgifera]|uniref:UNC93-like protein MFSD11 n=1 Tax=Diabrotica virgifera virgifera TaxID=50390 RepID=A0ABM5KFH4_DIAVI|nr:UNC93-like protein MFSD11 [Diabrotica virgifera virgifera]
MTGTFTLSNIQKTIVDSIQKEDSSFTENGYYSLALNNAFYALFNWITPSVIHLIGSKYSMCLGVIFNIMFILQFLIPKVWLLYTISALIGLGFSLLWVGEGNYITLNSTEDTISRNLGIFSFLSNFSMIFGNVLVMFAFSGKEVINEATRTYVILSLTGVCSAGLIIFCLLSQPVGKKDTNEEDVKVEGPVEAFVSATKLFITRKMLLLSFSFLYSGLELGFFSGVYSSCVGFTKKFDDRKQLVGISGILIGVGGVFGGGVLSLFGQKLLKLGRSYLAIVACSIHTLCFALIFINLPNSSTFSDTDEEAVIESSVFIAMFCAFLLGLGDSVFINVIYSLLGTVYSENSACAFAIFQFFQAIGIVINFVTAPVLGLYYQLAILFVLGLTSTTCYIHVNLSYTKANFEINTSKKMSNFKEYS